MCRPPRLKTMSHDESSSLHTPAFVRASAFTPAQVEQLGVPRGLLPYKPNGPEPAPASEIPAMPEAAVTAMAEVLLATAAQPAPAHGLGPRTRFRFQAHHAEAPIVPPSNLTTDPNTSRRAGAVRKIAKVSALAQWLSLAAVAMIALVAGFFFASPGTGNAETREATAAKRLEQGAWSAADIQKLNAILVAERAGRTREMSEMIERLQTTRPNLSGLPLLEARAALARRVYSDAEVMLARGARETSAEPAEISFGRATVQARQRRFDETRAWLTDAITRDPMRAEMYFEKAEVERRLGHTSDALATYELARALAQPGRIPSRETIDFHRRLLLIERGRETEIDAKAYQAAFAKAEPPADWMLIAAALEFQRRDAAAAAHWLKASRDAMPWREYVTRLDDYAFRNHVEEPAVRDLFPTPAQRDQLHAELAPFLIDP